MDHQMKFTIGNTFAFTLGSIVSILAVLSGSTLPGYAALVLAFLMVVTMTIHQNTPYTAVGQGVKYFLALSFVLWALLVVVSAICAVL